MAPTDSAPLVVIYQMNPILVQYTIPQQSLPEVRSYQGRGTIPIFITHEDGSGDLGQGKLVFVDNNVNTTTATVTLKARVTNEAEQLWPGQYVGVRMQLTVQPDAVVVPETAVQIGQEGNFLYLVKDGNAQSRKVTVDRQIGDLAVITSGVTPGQIVVTRVPRDLRSGSAVETGASSAAPRHSR